jgi:hypothetical protein
VELRGGQKKFCSKECEHLFSQHVPTPEFYEVAHETLSLRRLEGRDPAHGGEAARKRGSSNRERARQRADWDAAHRGSEKLKEWFAKEVVPALASIPISRIVEATGFSPGYASLVRKGEYLPHPVHFRGLTRLARIRETEET